MKYLMNLVFKKVLPGICLMLVPALIGSIHAQNTPAFDELRSFFEDGYVFEAEFLHTYKDDFTGAEQRTEGKIWIGRDQYKIEGDNQLMIVDGDVSRVYDGTKNRVIISEYIEEEDDFAPSRMLQGVDETFSVSESQLENSLTEVRLVSDDPFSIFLEVTILLDQDRNPLEIEAVDQVDNMLITTFSTGEFVEENSAVFDFIYPEDAEIIDLRHES